MTSSTEPHAAHAAVPPRASWLFLRLPLAALLLTATCLEAHRLATEPVPGSGLLASRGVLLAFVEAEVLLAFWLLSGLWPRLAWLAALACFLAFSGITLVKGLQGLASCGCFGRLHVNPWLTFLLDTAAVAALLAVRRRLRHVQPPRRPRLRLAVALAASVSLGLPLALAVASYAPTRISDRGDLLGDGGFVLLEPLTWPGRSFHLLPHIDAGANLARGRWVVLLYAEGCSGCADALPRYRRIAQPLRDKAVSLAFVQLPPHHAHPAPHADPNLLHALLDDRRQWFLPTPSVVLLADGVVLAAWEGTAPPLPQLLQRLP